MYDGWRQMTLSVQHHRFSLRANHYWYAVPRSFWISEVSWVGIFSRWKNYLCHEKFSGSFVKGFNHMCCASMMSTPWRLHKGYFEKVNMQKQSSHSFIYTNLFNFLTAMNCDIPSLSCRFHCKSRLFTLILEVKCSFKTLSNN